LYSITQLLGTMLGPPQEGQVTIRQYVEEYSGEHPADYRIPKPDREYRRAHLTKIATLATLLLLAVAPKVHAQSRGEVQIGARILRAGPSQIALAAALKLPAQGPDPELAHISRELPKLSTDTDRAMLPPRAIVTIEFLRN
jgi:hypothetical protein